MAFRCPAKIQGVKWFSWLGLREEDHLATTWEAFVDVNWIRNYPPVMGYHRPDSIKA
jgi:hypothetical protein